MHKCTNPAALHRSKWLGKGFNFASTYQTPPVFPESLVTGCVLPKRSPE